MPSIPPGRKMLTTTGWAGPEKASAMPVSNASTPIFSAP